jgi:DMSO/TMAO reductase YedYZ heme-binding membrane subunit
MAAGPFAYVLPWMPINGHLIAGRRALGICAFASAALHAACYLVPLAAARSWSRLYQPGALWVLGLALAVPLFVGMGTLAATSSNRAVRALGPKRWKRWHRLVYVLLPVALVHAICVGADFGVNKPVDVSAEADAGCLVGMSLAAALWLALFIARRQAFRWTPSFVRRDRSDADSGSVTAVP